MVCEVALSCRAACPLLQLSLTRLCPCAHAVLPQLLYQLCQGDASPLAAYICHLPGIAPGIPTPGVAMLCAPAVREAFQDPQLAADAEGQWYWCQRFSEEVLSSLPGTPGDPFHGVTITPRLLGAWSPATLFPLYWFLCGIKQDASKGIKQAAQ